MTTMSRWLPSSGTRERWLLSAALVVTVIVALSLLAARHARERALSQLAHQMRGQLLLHADAVQALVERYRVLPAVLALDPEVRSALLQTAPSAETIDRLNHKLEQVNGAAATSTLTLLDRDGLAIAASNWGSATSNVGQRYAFRPYFELAVQHGAGAFYGLGVTTGVPGFFLSRAVQDDHGTTIGVVAVKLVMRQLEDSWASAPDIILVSDAHDVVFLSSRDDWRYTALRPLNADERTEFAHTRQYGNVAINPLPVTRLAPSQDDVQQVRLPNREPRIWLSLSLPDYGWTLHLLRRPDDVANAGRTAMLATAAALSALAFLLLFARQRQRLAEFRSRSQRELERLVEQHAVEMRTAETALVEAANRAETGESRALAHLPQGVCVVDSQLRLTAWNRRYIELFRYPPGFIEVGRPIEDVLRFNARRGLLGPGPVDEAIQRRLEYLRSNNAHRYERERPDGQVIEINGNPLPDGGYVTSYADITAYRNAARELRSLADTLEHRIEERTRDLEAARRDAENANRAKTRFVAGAVHDLMQPLNAARMFVSALRERLLEPAAAQLAHSVDQSLQAQEQILGSLLDISRLESGKLETRVRDFALEPLLEALAREFGIIASSRGLNFRHVPTHCWVHSDEALLRRIVQNLLSNAVRYTRQGDVLLGCRRDGERLRIEVHDTGPGIPQNRHQEIFEEFRRLDQGRDGQRGAGLGLAIVDRIARLLGHTIVLHSTVGRGSVFSVSVPLAARGNDSPAEASTITPPPVATDDTLDGVPVWIIDDDPQVCAATASLLQRWNCRVGFAGGPQDARARARDAAAPEILLLDVRMGAITGPELLPELQRRWVGHPGVILVTAERDPALRDLAAESGWGLLHKPVKPAALRGLMMQMRLRSGQLD